VPQDLALLLLVHLQVIVQAEELSNARETLTITIAGSNLLDVEAIGSSDPFLEIHRQQVGPQLSTHSLSRPSTSLSFCA
jgi:hypothetical protein